MKLIPGKRPDLDLELQLEEVKEEVQEWYNVKLDSKKASDKEKVLKRKAMVINGIIH